MRPSFCLVTFLSVVERSSALLMSHVSSLKSSSAELRFCEGRRNYGRTWENVGSAAAVSSSPSSGSIIFHMEQRERTEERVSLMHTNVLQGGIRDSAPKTKLQPGRPRNLTVA